MILNIIGFLSGFLFSSVLDTTLGEFQEWAIVGSAIIVASLELLNKIFYYLYFKIQPKFKRKYEVLDLLNILNFLKIGLIYGLIVDAFKLGS
jgi:hypothetical protein